MAFSETVRRRALVASARHCCVCHRYKAAKIEVHHIIQPAKGGNDDPENAIALCFDCHTDAGHYNPNHPRGTKFSPKELRTARDKWYGIVRKSNIQPTDKGDFLYCRFLVCKDFEAFKEICEEDLSRLPVERPILSQNEIHSFHLSIIRARGKGYRPNRIWGKSYASKSDYLTVHPEATEVQKDRTPYPYFDTVRIPSNKELYERIAEDDGLTRLLLEADVKAADLSRVVAYWDECGQPCFQEEYLLRPLWVVYLAASNISGGHLSVESLKCTIDNTQSIDFRPFNNTSRANSASRVMPSVRIEPNATVVIPVATILAPPQALPGKIWSTRTSDLDTAGHWQEVSHLGFDPNDLELLQLIGPAIWPISFVVEVSGLESMQDIHKLNLSNLYTIDRFWAIGSCPHLFFRRCQSNLLEYYGEILSGGIGGLTQTSIEIPKEVTHLIIAELENETTFIDKLLINNITVLSKAKLLKDDVVKVRVKHGQNALVKGYYTPEHSMSAFFIDPCQKNDIISRFMATRPSLQLTGKTRGFLRS